MTVAALTTIAAAMLLVRLGWNGARRLAIAGWAIGAVALRMLARADGAWGLAMGTLAGIAAAFAILLHAAWTTPAGRVRQPREPLSITLPRAPADMGRRVAVFVLVVPVAFVAAQWLAFAVQAMARGRGAGEADATAMVLFLQPLLWASLMAWQMTRAGPSRMIAAPAAAALVGTVLWTLA